MHVQDTFNGKVGSPVKESRYVLDMLSDAEEEVKILPFLIFILLFHVEPLIEPLKCQILEFNKKDQFKTHPRDQTMDCRDRISDFRY